MIRDTTSVQAASEHLCGEHLGCAQGRITGVVDEHCHPATGRRGEFAHAAHMLMCVGIGVLDPRNAAHDVGTELDRLAHELLGARVAQQPVLRERDDLQVDHAAELLAQPQ